VISSRRTGKRGEEVAAAYLERLGYQVLEHNFRTRFAELDLVCRHGPDLVFVEVKARTSHRFGLPEEAVTSRKRQKLRLAISQYLETYSPRFRRLRLEVLAIDLQAGSLAVQDIRHIKDIY
jgi:putative endonuclease